VAKIRVVHFPWQRLWIVIIMYVCHFSSFSTKQNEQWEFCWESKDNYKKEERGKKKHFAWMRERITTWRSGCYGRQNVERRTSSTFRISSITFSSSLSIFFFRLWPKKVNWIKVTSFNKEKEWSFDVVFALGTINYFS